MHPPMIRSWSGWRVLSFSPIHQEIGQSLRLDCCSRLILNVVGGNLDCPLGYSSGCISTAHDVGKRSRDDDRNWMSLKVRLQSLSRHVNSISHLLVVRIVLL